jgi:hypothetical protein
MKIFNLKCALHLPVVGILGVVVISFSVVGIVGVLVISLSVVGL